MGIPSIGSTPPIIRLAHPLAFAALLQHVGAPVERHFRRSGLPAYCDDPAQFVPLRSAWALFDSAAHSEDPLFGWHVGRFVGNRLSRQLLARLESSPTLYEALKRFARLVGSEASQLQLGILERPDDILFYTHYPDLKHWPGYSSSQSYQLRGVFLDVIRHFLGRDWVPEEIGMETGAVPRVVEEDCPGSRILTNRRMGYVAVRRSDLHRAPPSRSTPAGQDGSLVIASNLDFLTTLRAVLKAYLADGYPSAQLAARLMETSVRTLARRLEASSMTYQGLIDELRFEVARDLLTDADARIGDVGLAVGFADPAHFARMFRRVAGLSPRQFRETLAA